MTIKLIALGHKAPEWIEKGCAEYRERLPKEWRFEECLLKAERRNDQTPSTIIKTKEALRITQHTKECTLRIVLDEHGKHYDSQTFAKFIQRHHDNSEKMAWIIGGTDGLDADLIENAHFRFSLSRFTLTHDLARLLLMEQLYRASTILSGHPYHRETC
jgi:23S rRNA (pseudouridine1915-N3)-methyltransferase